MPALNVFSNGRSIGSLDRDYTVNRTVYRFDYAPGIGREDTVSLVMEPPGPRLFEQAGKMHPVFDMNLPEGALRGAIIRMFSKTLDTAVFDDFTLLGLVGQSLIGRLRFGQGQQIGPIPEQNLKQLLEHRGTKGLFDALLERYARYSGVSGVQPKVMVRDDGSLNTSPSGEFSPGQPLKGVTAKGTTHILKHFDPIDRPGLAANEFLCLKAAIAAGLPVPPTFLSDDGEIFAIERFDLKPDGTYLAFEDLCSIAGKVSDEKYEGTYEEVAATLARYLPPDSGDMRLFFKSLVLSVIVRNGDAHRKNFGVLYDDPTQEIRLAPVYDVVTTLPYLPDDNMALKIGDSKHWPDEKILTNFGIKHCSVVKARESIQEVAQGVADTRAQLHDELRLPTDIAVRMAQIWEAGLMAVDSARAVRGTSIFREIEESVRRSRSIPPTPKAETEVEGGGPDSTAADPAIERLRARTKGVLPKLSASNANAAPLPDPNKGHSPRRGR
jgi:serine/threonine-protein kinase HipA